MQLCIRFIKFVIYEKYCDLYFLAGYLIANFNKKKLLFVILDLECQEPHTMSAIREGLQNFPFHLLPLSIRPYLRSYRPPWYQLFTVRMPSLNCKTLKCYDASVVSRCIRLYWEYLSGVVEQRDGKEVHLQ